MSEEIKIIVDTAPQEVEIIVQTVEEVIEVSVQELAGPKGRDFYYTDFTPEQLALLKGEKGDAFQFSDFTPEQIELIRGEKGEAFTYQDFTPEQLALLKGADGQNGWEGPKGDTGDSFLFENFTPEQLESLRGPEGDISPETIELLNSIASQVQTNAGIAQEAVDQINAMMADEHTETVVTGVGERMLFNLAIIDDPRGFLPTGWLLPVPSDWNALVIRVTQDLTPTGWAGAAGKQLKVSGTDKWQSTGVPNDGIDSFGFHAVPTGMRYADGSFDLSESIGLYLTIHDTNDAIGAKGCTSSQPTIYSRFFAPNEGVAIRLVRQTTQPHGHTGTITMPDGTVLTTIVFGDREWMSQDYKSAKFLNGENIPIVSDDAAWAASTETAACYFNNEVNSETITTPAGSLKQLQLDVEAVKDDVLAVKEEIITRTKGDPFVYADFTPQQLAALKGDKGDDGEASEIRIYGGYIQWKLVSGASWTNLIALTALTGSAGANGSNGADGADGQDGSSVELQVSGGYIQWRLVGGNTWTNLIAVSVLKGDKGDTGNDGADGADGSNGRGIASTSYNASTGVLTITYTDATTYATGDLRDTGIEININFLDLTAFVYNVPKAMVLTTQESEGTAATLSIALNTNMARYAKLTITPTVIGLVTLKGNLL